MNLLQKSWAFMGVFFLFFGFTLAVHAQGFQQPSPDQQEVREDFSEDELQKFVSAATKAQEVQQVRQQDMISAIQEEELDIERFNEIMAVQQGQSQDADVSDEEMQAFNAAAQKVMEHQREMQAEIAQTIQDEGITMDTYNQISMAYQQSPKIQEKITKILEEE